MTRRRLVSTNTRLRCAFTLLELLVVISVIVLLIGILIPSLSAARRSGQRTQCQANLREIAAGWHIYLDENEGRFLQSTNASVNYGGGQGSLAVFQGPKPLNAALALEPILPEAATVFRCPSDRGGGPAKDHHFRWCGTSYVMNPMLSQPGLQVAPNDPCEPQLTELSQRLPGLTRSRIGPESKLILAGDFGWGYDWDRNDAINKARWHTSGPEHNVAFMDGHVSFLRIRKGLHVTQDYHVIPFADVVGAIGNCQQEVTPP